MISNEVRNVLNDVKVTGTNLALTGQLDRNTYVAVNKVLEALGGKWSRKEKSHIFDEDPNPLIQQVLVSGEMPDKNPLAYFPTPKAVVQQMMSYVDFNTVFSVLEPSAGEGHILDIVLETEDFTEVVALELDNKRFQKLSMKDYPSEVQCYQGDFLEFPLYHLYDLVMMNPPFAVKGNPQAYIDHVTKAWSFTKLELVAIVPVSFTFRQDKKSTAFRELVENHGTWYKLDTGSFKESGTMVNTVLVHLKKEA